MTKGLYFYKLVSPYSEDITKDCKLTVNEIDSNFLNLKNADINNVHVDEEKKKLILTRNNGEELVLNISKVIPELGVEFDAIDGVLTLEHDGAKYSIEGLITKDNLSKEILTKVFSDSTLSGIGTSKEPLRISSVYKTGYYRPVKKVIDTVTKHDKIPHKHLEKGDRYVVLEEVQDYGLLYDFHGVKHINKLLENSGWRVPSKEDWDNMLNALEPCEYRNHNSALNNRVLGKMAGSLLKSEDEWRTPHCDDHHHDHCDHHHHDHCGHHHHDFDHNKPCKFELDDDFEYPFEEYHEDRCECKHPHEKPVPSLGKDAYGMNILPSGYAYFAKPPQYNRFGYQGAYWTTDTLYDTDVYTKVFEANESGVMQVGERPTAFLAIRLVKDYNGTNHRDVEDILGKNYKTVLLPSLNNVNGFTVWTAQNLDFVEKHIETLIPNAGLGVDKRKVYFVYEWNGFDWEKLEMVEGDSITVLEGARPNESYRIIDGRLVNITDTITNNVLGEVKDELDIIKTRLNSAEDMLNDHEERIEKAEEAIETAIGNIEELQKDLEEEKSTREEVEKQIWGAIEQEAKAREEVDNQQWAAIEGETARAQEVEAQLWEGINGEIARAQEVEAQLWEGINGEIARAQEVETQLWGGIDNEANARKEVDDQLWNAIAEETQARTEVEAQLWEGIAKEASAREEVDNQQWAAIEGETKRAQEVEAQLWEGINGETNARLEVEAALWEGINGETARAQEVEAQLWEGINNEAKTREEEDKKLDDRVVDLEGRVIKIDECNYDEKEGVLTLPTEVEENTIKIQFSYDFGEVDFLN